MNTSTGYTFFQLNYDYHLHISYEEDINHYFKSKLVDELPTKLKKIMIISYENLYHT